MGIILSANAFWSKLGNILFRETKAVNYNYPVPFIQMVKILGKIVALNLLYSKKFTNS